MGFVFKKITTGEVVSSSGDMVFRKLSTEVVTPPPVSGLDPESFDLRWLGLTAGTHIITATTSAPSLRLAESERSNSVEYKVD